MNMNISEGSMNMTEGSMSMVMTFGKFTDFKLQLLFSFWDIQTISQYVFSWLFVVICVIFWHGLKYFTQTTIEESLRKLMVNSKDTGENVCETEYQLAGNRQPLLGMMSSATLKRIWILRVVHAFMSALIYGLALLLMLVAMTYNIGLFLSLVVGYFLGDLLFYSISIQSVTVSAKAPSQLDCH